MGIAIGDAVIYGACLVLWAVLFVGYKMYQRWVHFRNWEIRIKIIKKDVRIPNEVGHNI